MATAAKKIHIVKTPPANPLQHKIVKAKAAVAKAKEFLVVNGTKYIRMDIYLNTIHHLQNNYNLYIILLSIICLIVGALVVGILVLVLVPIIIPIIQAKLSKKTLVIQLQENRRLRLLVPHIDLPELGILVIKRKSLEGIRYDYITYKYDINIVEFCGCKAIIIPPDSIIPLDVRTLNVPYELSLSFINRVLNSVLTDIEIKLSKLHRELRERAISKAIASGGDFLKNYWWIFILILLFVILAPMLMSLFSGFLSGGAKAVATTMRP